MGKSFDLQSIIWLINSEIRSAVAAIQVESGAMEIQQVRVRMGQDRQTATAGEKDSIRLATDRYPLAEQGWLVDVTYDPLTPELYTAVLEKEFEQAEDSIPVSWRGVSPETPVRYLEGVGPQRETVLRENGIYSLATLIDFDFNRSTAGHKVIIRRSQVLARLAVQAPPVALNPELLKHSAMTLINQPHILSKAKLSAEGETALYQWLLTLEICFNDAWLKRTTLNRMVNSGR